ncbi:phytanoyl-CoA dioxygenase family protein [Sulfitobacter alexandrii]|uniref:phytanoyl-CoA dioxygenase family protein n=1 Tax=Sulfitobacter alexandrii TaxID=1917485 RepID=UPI000B23A9CF|nr:phytanoyl-CoA dioxygenase family protein [Sulfitobacter alexandrii]
MTGFRVFDPDPATRRWAEAAHGVAQALAADPGIRARNLRHGGTWFVGVDVLPNAADGSIAGVPLAGAWRAAVTPPAAWHAAQVSIVYPGYPGRDPDESEANHRFRVIRHAAHVDGLLPEDPARRRYLREPHGFILGLPLNRARAAPLMVWPGSHRMMGDALRHAVAERDPADVDLTEAYADARRAVFDAVAPVPVHAEPGQAVLLHRHLLHGVAPWSDAATAPAEGRMIAYFRPQISAADWLAP